MSVNEYLFLSLSLRTASDGAVISMASKNNDISTLANMTTLLQLDQVQIV